MEVERSTIMNFNMSKFITVPLMSLFYYDRRFHVRVDVAMIGIGRPHEKFPPVIMFRNVLILHSKEGPYNAYVLVL